jgi:N-acetylglucosaminyl-diphospho-decaprenol L-rhamnosyltransferase
VPQTPTFGLIIVTYNSRAHFARLKTAIDGLRERDFRLIVWDNASAPEQRPKPDDLPAGAELIQCEENLGFAIANNRAAALLDTPFIALVNPDAFPEPDWLDAMRAAAARFPNAAAFGSTQINADDRRRFDGLGDCYFPAGVAWRGGFGLARTFAPRSGECFSVCGAASVYRAGAWRAEGGFDEAFVSFGEDVDLGFRLRLCGWQIVQIAEAVVRHVGGGSTGAKSAYAVRHGTRNRTWTFVKNMPAPLFWLMAPAHIAITLLFLAISPFRGTGAPTRQGVAEAIAGLGRIWRQRRAVQRARRVKLSVLMRVMSWNPLAMAKRAPVLRPLPDNPD